MLLQLFRCCFGKRKKQFAIFPNTRVVLWKDSCFSDSSSCLQKDIESRSSSSFWEKMILFIRKRKCRENCNCRAWLAFLWVSMHVVVGFCKTSFDLTHKSNLRIFFCQHDLDFLPEIHLPSLAALLVGDRCARRFFGHLICCLILRWGIIHFTQVTGTTYLCIYFIIFIPYRTM